MARVSVGAALLALFAADATCAQDGSESRARTPEGAQRFLAEFLPREDVPVSIHSRIVDGKVGPYADGQQGRWVQWYGRVTSVRAEGLCRTLVETGALVPTLYTPPLESRPAAPPTFVVPVDWPKIKQVAVSPEPKSINTVLGGSPRQSFVVSLTVGNREVQPPLFLFDVKEEAERVGHAFDFLRGHCASASDTGFRT